jgi:hypothetical protein
MPWLFFKAAWQNEQSILLSDDNDRGPQVGGEAVLPGMVEEEIFLAQV